MRSTPQKDSAGDAAIQWWLRLTSGEACEQDRRDCEAWRSAAAENDQAWLRLHNGLSQSVGRLAPTLAPRGSSLRDTLERPPRRRVLLSAAALAGAASGAWLMNRHTPLANFSADLGTHTAQRSDFVLPDGSVLTLDARSRVDLDFSPGQRTVHLLAGAVIAHLQADRQSPFVVRTEHGDVRSFGARYMVRLEDHATLAVVLAQEAEIITRGQQQRTVPAGQGTRFGADWIDRPVNELSSAAAWRDGLLEVHDRPLSEVVTALQRYWPGVLRLSPAAADIRVSGLYPLDDTERALSALAHTTPISLKHYTRWFTFIEPLSA